MPSNPNSQGGIAPSSNFIHKNFSKALPYDEWIVFLQDLNRLLNSMMDYASNETYKNPNLPNQAQLAALNLMLNNPLLFFTNGTILNNLMSGVYVVGPASSTINGVAVYADTTGKLISSPDLQIVNDATTSVIRNVATQDLSIYSAVRDLLLGSTNGLVWIQNSPLTMNGITTPSAPSMNLIKIYKLTSKANKLFYQGENARESLIPSAGTVAARMAGRV